MNSRRCALKYEYEAPVNINLRMEQNDSLVYVKKGSKKIQTEYKLVEVYYGNINTFTISTLAQQDALPRSEIKKQFAAQIQFFSILVDCFTP